MEIDEIETREKKDFRRANGAPMIIDKEGKNKRLSRPSSWGKILDDENALVNWKIDRACEGVANDPALQARYAAVKPDDRETYKKLRELAINAGRGDQAADIGTALHAMSERWEDPADDFNPPEEYARRLRNYSETLERYGLVSELFEYHVVSLKWGAAGTADRLYRTTKPLVAPSGEIIPVGTLFVGDLKTGKKLDYSLPGYCVQMAIYADGELYDVEADEFLETPEINRDWGLLVHLPAEGDTCTIIWCDMGVGEWGAQLVQGVKDWRRKWKSVQEFGAFEAVPPTDDDAIAAELDAEPVSPEELVAFVQARLNTLRDIDGATVKLSTYWPEGVPTPKAGLSEPDHIQQVLSVLDRVEAELQVGWPEGDPRTRLLERGALSNNK